MPMARSTSGAFVKRISSYWTTWTRLPHGSWKLSPRPGSGSTPASWSAARNAARSSTTSPKWARPRPCRRDGQELVAGVEERHVGAVAPTVLEGHQAAVEREGGVDVVDLEGDVVEAEEAGARVGHGTSVTGSGR